MHAVFKEATLVCDKFLLGLPVQAIRKQKADSEHTAMIR